MLYVGIGFLLVLFMRLMRGNFLWWPFHPAGYALSVSFAMDYFWFCFFVAWVAKALIIRFGGMKAHNSAVPFFLGLILGDYVVGVALVTLRTVAASPDLQNLYLGELNVSFHSR